MKTPTAKNKRANAAGDQTILLAVTGMSPAILTETIWALAEEKPAVVPDRVVAITTAAGKARLMADLCEGKPEFGGKAVWDALREGLEARGDSTADRLRLDVRVIYRWNERGLAEELPDIRDADENEAAADFILEEVRRVAENPETRLIASIAGGRKTMGALLHAAMTLLGRETDRITHVLVQEPFETGVTPRFYFPGQTCGELQDREGAKRLAKDCRIELTDVPFVPIRNLFEGAVRKPGSFREIIRRCQRGMNEIRRDGCRVQVLTSEPKVKINGVELVLPWAQYVILRFFAEHVLEGNTPFSSYKDVAPLIAELAREIYDSRGGTYDWRDKIDSKLIDGEFLTKRLNDLRTSLTGKGAASDLIDLLPKKGQIYLKLESRQVKVDQDRRKCEDTAVPTK